MVKLFYRSARGFDRKKSSIFIRRDWNLLIMIFHFFGPFSDSFAIFDGLILFPLVGDNIFSFDVEVFETL